MPAVDIRLLSLGFLAGVLLVCSLTALPSPLIYLLPLVVLVILAVLRKAPGAMCSMGLNTAVVILIGGLLGAMWSHWQGAERLATRLQAADTGQVVWLKGHISGLPEKLAPTMNWDADDPHADRTQIHDWRFYFKPEEGRLRKIRVSWYRTEALPAAGQCWQLQLKLKPPRGLSNPGSFDYESWLFRQAIDAAGYVKSAETCSSSEPWMFVLQKWRQALADHLRSELSPSPGRALFLALVLGDRSEISDAQWAVFRHTGTSHLMAISGLHIGLVSAFVLLLCQWLWSRSARLCLWLPAPKAAAVCAALAALVYALLAGFALPAQRALAMLLVVLMALFMGRVTAPSRILSIALLAVLLIDPFAVLSAGFWLSFAAVGWILYALSGRLRQHRSHQTAWYLRWRDWFWIQLVLALGLAPVTLYAFGESSWVAPLANLILIPVFTLLLPLIIAAVLLSMIWPAVGVAGLGMNMRFLDFLWQVLNRVDGFWQFHWSPPTPALWTVILAMMGLVLLLSPKGMPGKLAAMMLCLPMLLLQPDKPRYGQLVVTVLDVGQGLAVALQTHQHTLLYDAGPSFRSGFNTGEAVVLPWLRQQGIQRLDALILSHDHNDHSGGIAAIVDAVPVSEMINTQPGKTCEAGYAWVWDEVRFEILHPASTELMSGRWDVNNISCVLKVTSADYAVLLPGDIESQAELHLSKTRAEQLNADLLIAPHHGSRTSSTQAFINRVSPQAVIVSAGAANRWGMPHEPVVDRYEQAGAKLLSTADTGSVQVVWHETDRLMIRPWRQHYRRFWHADSTDAS